MSSTREASLDWTSCRNGAFLCVLPKPLKAARSRTPLAIWPWRGRAGGSGCCRKLKEPNMAKLTNTQLIVLSKAAARNDGTAIIPEGLNKAAATKVERKPCLSQADARGAVETRFASMARR